MRLARYETMTDSGQVQAARANLLGYILGTDGVTNVRMSIHNGASASDPIVKPTITYDAAALGANGAMFTFLAHCPGGVYFNKVSGANFELTVYYETY